MPLSPEIDNQIRKRFEELEAEANRLVEYDNNSSDILWMIDPRARSASSDNKSDFQRCIAEKIETNVVADYLTQAEQLLNGNRKRAYTYGPAAVLAGAVLEDSLRRLCARQTPPISTNKPGGHPKTMGTLIDDLKNAGLFNELKAKQLRAWADIRNAAAHGRFEDFTKDDVEQLIAGIQSFLVDYL